MDVLEETKTADDWTPCPKGCGWSACDTCPKHRVFFATIHDVRALRAELKKTKARVEELEDELIHDKAALIHHSRAVKSRTYADCEAEAREIVKGVPAKKGGV